MVIVISISVYIKSAWANRDNQLAANEVLQAFQSNGLNCDNPRYYNPVDKNIDAKVSIVTDKVGIYEYENKKIADKNYPTLFQHKPDNVYRRGNVIMYVWETDKDKAKKYVEVFKSL